MIKQSSPSALLSRIAPLALIFLASTHLYAQEPISVSLTGSTVVPPVVTTARGTGQFTITPDHVVIGSIKTFGLVPTMAHIHEAPVGQNGPVIVTLGKTADDSYAVPPNTKLSQAQYASFIAGNLYVHIHTAQHPDGALRGQLLPLKAGEKPKGSY